MPEGRATKRVREHVSIPVDTLKALHAELEELRANAHEASGASADGMAFMLDLDRAVHCGRIPEAERELWWRLFYHDPAAARAGIAYRWRTA